MIIIGLILLPEKLKYLNTWIENLMHQKADLSKYHLLIYLHGNTEIHAKYLEALTVLNDNNISYKLFNDKIALNNNNKGKLANIRQFILEKYLEIETTEPIIFCSADLYWDDNFLIEHEKSKSNITASIYCLNGKSAPCAYIENISDNTYLDFNNIHNATSFGMGGISIKRESMKLFNESGGWTSYYNNEEPKYSESAFLSKVIKEPISFITTTSAWHENSNGTSVKISFIDNSWITSISGYGYESNLDCNKINDSPNITIGIPISGNKKYSLSIITKAILEQNCSLSNVSIIFGVQNSQSIISDLQKWKDTHIDLFNSITILDAPAPDMKIGFQPQELYAYTVSKVRQLIALEYITSSSDDGLLWWDSDNYWDSNFISRISANQWPIIVVPYPSRVNGSLAHQHTESNNNSLSLDKLEETIFLRLAGLGGTFISRDYMLTFMNKGGWNNFLPYSGEDPENRAEDWYLLANLEPPSLMLHDISGWHIDSSGQKCKIGKDKLGRNSVVFLE